MDPRLVVVLGAKLGDRGLGHGGSPPHVGGGERGALDHVGGKTRVHVRSLSLASGTVIALGTLG